MYVTYFEIYYFPVKRDSLCTYFIYYFPFYNTPLEWSSAQKRLRPIICEVNKNFNNLFEKLVTNYLNTKISVQ